jgi:GDP-4-dehydro-6-deoxy-D-mannose reductase
VCPLAVRETTGIGARPLVGPECATRSSRLEYNSRVVRLLITGITGFVGSHFAEFALAHGVDVVGSVRWRSRTEHIEHLRPRITLVESDLRDLFSVRTLLERARPDYIVHLAAQSFVAASWQTPSETLYTNTISQVNLFEGMRQLGLEARFLVIGSSEEYGLVHPEELPIRETNPLRPLSPYAVSKVAQDLMGWQYFKSYGLEIVRARAFNHTGPRRGESFATSNFAKQVAEIEAGLRPPVIHVGDLKPTRDFSDVRDIVRGYWLLLERGTAGEVYNLCSGKDWSIERVLQFLVSKSKITGIDVREDPARLRPSDVPILRGSAEKIEHALGWCPRIPLEDTLTDLMEYWRQRVRPSAP